MIEQKPWLGHGNSNLQKLGITLLLITRGIKISKLLAIWQFFYYYMHAILIYCRNANVLLSSLVVNWRTVCNAVWISATIKHSFMYILYFVWADQRDKVCFILHVTVGVGYLCYYMSPRWSQGWVLITKISYDYCDITGLFPT